MSLFGVDIQSAVAEGFKGQLKAATLHRTSISNYDPVNETESQSTSTFTSEGFVEEYEDRMIADGLVQENDRKVILLAGPLGTRPTPGDSDTEPDTIEIGGAKYTVISVKQDPDEATYTVQGRL